MSIYPKKTLTYMIVEDIKKRIDRLSAIKGVMAVIVAARDGLPMESTIDNTSTVLYVGGMVGLEDWCTSMVRDIDPEEELQFLRVRTQKFEVFLCKGEEFYTILVQNIKKRKRL